MKIYLVTLFFLFTQASSVLCCGDPVDQSFRVQLSASSINTFIKNYLDTGAPSPEMQPVIIEGLEFKMEGVSIPLNEDEILILVKSSHKELVKLNNRVCLLYTSPSPRD